MPLVDIGDAQLFVDDVGTGEPLLLVSGLGGTSGFWHHQVAALAENYRVIRFDHRGVGRSPDAPLIDSTMAMSEDVIRLMDALDIDRATIVGHSTGGAIGQHIAIASPERVRSLVLSASWAGPTPLFTETFALRRAVLRDASISQYMLLGCLLAMPGAYLSEHFGDGETFLNQRIQNFPGVEVELGRLKAVVTHDLRAQLAQITVPTGVISALDDALTPIALSDELAQLIPGAVQQTLPEGGHFCPVTQYEQYSRTLLPLLRSL